jgi:hypothetical protein
VGEGVTALGRDHTLLKCGTSVHSPTIEYDKEESMGIRIRSEIVWAVLGIIAWGWAVIEIVRGIGDLP